MGIKLNLPDSVMDYFSDEHPLCSFKKGERVIKKTWDEGDMHPIDTEGTIIGTCWKEDSEEEVLLVQMDTNPEGTYAITLPYKFDKL